MTRPGHWNTKSSIAKSDFLSTCTFSKPETNTNMWHQDADAAIAIDPENMKALNRKGGETIRSLSLI
jgi:hypothetical protein